MAAGAIMPTKPIFIVVAGRLGAPAMGGTSGRIAEPARRWCRARAACRRDQAEQPGVLSPRNSPGRRAARPWRAAALEGDVQHPTVGARETGGDQMLRAAGAGGGIAVLPGSRAAWEQPGSPARAVGAHHEQVVRAGRWRPARGRARRSWAGVQQRPKLIGPTRRRAAFAIGAALARHRCRSPPPAPGLFSGPRAGRAGRTGAAHQPADEVGGMAGGQARSAGGRFGQPACASAGRARHGRLPARARGGIMDASHHVVACILTHHRRAARPATRCSPRAGTTGPARGSSGRSGRSGGAFARLTSRPPSSSLRRIPGRRASRQRSNSVHAVGGVPRWRTGHTSGGLDVRGRRLAGGRHVGMRVAARPAIARARHHAGWISAASARGHWR